NAETVAIELGSERFAEADEAELADVVGVEAAAADPAANAGHVDDVGFGPCQHGVEQSPGETDGGEQIDREQAVPLFVGHTPCRAVPADAGVVHEDVEGAPAGVNVFDQAIDAG